MHKTFRNALLAAALVIAPSAAWAAPCADQYFNRVTPKVNASPALAASFKELCYSAFAVQHSSLTRTGIWAAEYLTAQDVRSARALERVDRFHEEPSLSNAQRASSRDYMRSGFDRGHLAPSGDMPDANAQEESFTLANMAPQVPSLNRGLWEEIEDTTRGSAERYGEIYVVTGLMFATNTPRLNGRVMIPSGFYKAIYNPRTHEAGAYVVMNVANAQYQVVSMTKLREMSGVDAFPSLPLNMRMRAADLPAPIRARVASAD